MYDPSFHLEIESYINDLAADTEQIRVLLGDSHPLTKVCENIDDSFLVVKELVVEYDSCFDDDERESIKKSIKEILVGIDKLWAVVEDKFGLKDST